MPAAQRDIGRPRHEVDPHRLLQVQFFKGPPKRSDTDRPQQIADLNGRIEKMNIQRQ